MAHGEAGYVEGQNVAIKYRYAENQYVVYQRTRLADLRPEIFPRDQQPEALRALQKAEANIKAE
jgi:hypothetical protein